MLTGQAAFSGRGCNGDSCSGDPSGTRIGSDFRQTSIRECEKLLERCLQKESEEPISAASVMRGWRFRKLLADPSGVLVQPVTAAEPRTKLRTDASVGCSGCRSDCDHCRSGCLETEADPNRVRSCALITTCRRTSNSAISAIAALAVSPDGKQFVYSTTKGLYLRSVDELAAKLIAGTEGNTQQPFFSPDGKWIGYFSALIGS